jgi:hypothetical protein
MLTPLIARLPSRKYFPAENQRPRSLTTGSERRWSMALAADPTPDSAADLHFPPYFLNEPAQAFMNQRVQQRLRLLGSNLENCAARRKL